MKLKQLVMAMAALALTVPQLATAEASAEVRQVRAAWAHIKYELPKDQREQAFAELAQRSEQIVAAEKDQAEPLIWHAIVLASQAGEQGGLGALSLVRQARDRLLQAEAINPTAMAGSVYTSLGSLYYQVPGWPIGFGDDDKARDYLHKALALDPDGLDANFFHAGFLADQGDLEAALKAYQRALAAPPRPDRPVADAGRRGEIAEQIALLNRKMEH